MPKRILRDCTRSQRVNSLSWYAEVSFYRLLMTVDDWGCYFGDPMILKSYLFPLRDVRATDLSQWLNELAEKKLISFYKVDGKTYLLLHNFGQRLRSNNRKYPNPPKDILTSEDTCQQPADTCQQPADTCQQPADTCPPETRDERRETEEYIEHREPIDSDSHATAGNHYGSPIFHVPPTKISEVVQAANLIGYPIGETEADNFLATYQATGWKTSQGVPIRDWRCLLRKWRNNARNQIKPKQSTEELNQWNR